MSDRKWRTWEIAGLLFTIAAGNLLHFVYDWSGKNDIVAAFAATNESTWEHMKLLAVPWIVWSLIEWPALRRSKSPVLAARGAGLLAGLLAIPMLFYTYQGIVGRNSPPVNIIIFQVAVLLAFWVSWCIQGKRKLSGKPWQWLGGLLLLAAGVLFVLWTCGPPQLAVFMDPLTGQVGPS